MQEALHQSNQFKDLKLAFERQQQQQEWDAWVEDTIFNKDEVIPEDETPKLIEEFKNVDKRVLTIYDHEIMEATLRDMMSNQFKDDEEYAYHLEQPNNYMENQIVWESRQEDIRRSKPYDLYVNSEERKYVLSLHKMHAVPFPEDDLEEKMNYSFFEADFKYMNKNDIEDMSRIIWERVRDFQLGIESYQIKINLTAPILIFPGIEASDPYSIVDKPTTVLKEVKLRIFETGFLKKALLLDVMEGVPEYVMPTQLYVRKIIKDTSEDDHFTRGPWLSAIKYLNVEGVMAAGCLGDMKNYCKNRKLETVVGVIMSSMPNVLGDLTVTLKGHHGKWL
ncbi:hypothetical protein Tco_0787745, partial [Tanacetum coccineum]